MDARCSPCRSACPSACCTAGGRSRLALAALIAAAAWAGLCAPATAQQVAAAVEHGATTLAAARTDPPARAPAAGIVATAAQAYRAQAARHVYSVYADRIFKGMLPPLVHAIVVVETEIDATGQVRQVHVVRGPSHAPDVTAEVQRMIRAAAPWPAPVMGTPPGGGAQAGTPDATVTFTEVWLVDKSRRFQLHTLTEGQL